MSAQVLRPVFSENQILSAADVNSIVNHARNAAARHNRYLHSWGIATGLELVAETREGSGGSHVEVTLNPGLAINGNGREILVGESQRLSEDLFDQLNIAESVTDPATPPRYPVLLIGRDKAQQGSALAPSLCQDNSPTRTLESFEITFGRVGDAAGLDQQTPVELSAGIAEAGNWQILLGFVEWDGSHFSAVTDEDNGIGRRYVGLVAEDVVAPAGSLTLRTAERHAEDKAALVIDNENDGELRFGLQDSSGKVVPVFTVNAKGDVRAEGKILGAIAGGVQVESGIVSDGALLPLPAGITQAQLDSGEASIQVQLNPRFQQPASLPPRPTGDYWLMQPLECYADNRRAVCRVRWVATDGGDGPFVLPGVCDFQVFGFVKAEAN